MLRPGGASLHYPVMESALVWLAAFAFYLHSLTPGLGGEDSGEFVSAFLTIGSTHPPGYPLLVLLGRLIVEIPVGSPAFRANMLSAMCAAGVLTVVYCMAIRSAPGVAPFNRAIPRLSGLAAIGMLGGSQAFWYQAAISDKYPLHLLLFVSTLAAALYGSGWGRILMLLGLGLAHHPQMIYILPALAWLGWHGRVWRDSSWRIGLFAALAAISLKFLEAPLRGIGPWPLVFDPAMHFETAWSNVTLRPYAHRIHGPWESELWTATVRTLFDQVLPAGVMAGVAGLLLWARRDSARGMATMATVTTGLVLVSMLEIFGREYHALPVTLLLCLGCGMLAAEGFRPGRHPLMRLTGLVLLIPAWMIVRNLPMAGHGRACLDHDYGRQLLGGLPRRAVLLVSNDDHFFSTLHQQTVLGFRTDVLVIPRGYLTIPFLKERTRRASPELLPVLQGEAATTDEDRAARLAVELMLRDGRACFTTSAARREVYAGLRIEPRDAIHEIVNSAGHHPATSLWYPIRSWRFDLRAATWKHRLMIESQGTHQTSYAIALSGAGKVREAGTRYLHALANPLLDRPDALVANAATALKESGRLDAALRLYGQLVTKGTLLPEVHFNLGMTLLSAGRIPEAKRALTQARELASPGSAVFLAATRQLKRFGEAP